MPIPEQPIAPDQVLARIRGMKSEDANWKGGRCFALVYSAGEAHEALLRKAHEAYFAENGLNPMAFKGLKRLEHEVVQASANLFHGPEGAVGTMTSGGTESLLLAVKTYRDRAARTRRFVGTPEMILPRTAHVALEKAAHLFGVKLRFAPVGEDFRVDVKAVKRMINRHTVMLVGSAPQYPHGVIDPIEALSELALAHELPLHVDACVGGFMLPFVERLGRKVPLWDFRVPGVTSISADLHKYGYAAKGASVIVYRDLDHLRDQFFIATEWPGGIYASPSLPGTRPAGPIAAAWAALHGLGISGYTQLTQDALTAKDRLVAGIAAIPGLRVFGDPPATVIAFGSQDPALDTFALADRLQAKGWHFDRDQNPDGIHLTVMAGHLPVVDEFLADVRLEAEWVRAHPEAKREGSAATYGLMAKIPLRGMVKNAVLEVMLKMYGPSGEVPDLSKQDPNAGSLVDRLTQRYGGDLLNVLERAAAFRAAFGKVKP